jgi:hypothetical protein
VRALARSLGVVTALGVFYAVAAYARTGGPLATPPRPALVVTTAGAGGLAADISNLAAGDVVARTATLTNRGTQALQAIALAVTVTQSSALDRDRTSGLRIRLDRCSVAWAPGPPVRCAGRLTEVVAWQPLAANGSPWRLGGLGAGGSEWLRISLQLPPSATSQLAGRTTTVGYQFTAQ